MQLKLSPQAEHDLFGIHEFGSLHYGVRQADDYLDDLVKALGGVEEMPLAARERLEIRPPVRIRRHVAHNVCYRVEGDIVWVIRILHHSANWVDHL